MPSYRFEQEHNITWRNWFIWIIAGVCTLYQFLLQTSISVIIPSFVQELKINLVQTGILSSSYFYSYLLMQLPAGILVDRFGHRIILTLSFTIITIGCFWFAMTHDLSQAMWARIVMGFGSSAIIAASFSLVANWFPLKLYALLIAVTDALGMIGGVFGQGVFAVIVTKIGWRDSMIACGMLALVIAVLSAWMVRSHPKKVFHAAIKASEVNPPFLKALKKTLMQSQIWICGFYTSLTWGVIVAFAGLWAIPYFQTVYQFSLSTAAWLSSLIFLSIAIFNPIVGWLPNYFSEKIILFFSSLVFFIAFCVLLYIPSLSLVTLIILLILIGFSASGYILVFSIVREISPAESRATALGLTNLFAILIGSPILQPVIGFLLTFTLAHSTRLNAQHYQIALTVLPVCLLLSIILCLFIKVRKK